MLAKAISATPWGIDARLVQVEVDVHLGPPQMQIVGLPDAAVRESRERVRSAIKNCGFELAPRAVVRSEALWLSEAGTPARGAGAPAANRERT